MHIYDDVVDKCHLEDLYKTLTQRNGWYLSRSSNKDQKGKDCGFPGFFVSPLDPLFPRFLDILDRLRRLHHDRTNEEMPSHVHRLDVVAKQPNVKTRFHHDVLPKNDPDEEAYTIVGMLTPEWDKSWGGDFVVEKPVGCSSIHKIVTYKPGRFIIIKSTQRHNGMGPNQIIPYWRMVVNYVLKEPREC